jgi:predicted nuclease of predicted toxin-antitoxin system
MRILLDECLPRRLKLELPEHEVRTVAEMRWSGLKNGALLNRITGQFDLFLTVDRGLVHQQSLRGIPFAIIMMSAHSNDIDTLRPLMPQVRDLLAKLQPGEVVRVGAS